MKRLLKKATAGLLTLALVAGGVPAGTISEKIDSVKEAFVAEATEETKQIVPDQIIYPNEYFEWNYGTYMTIGGTTYYPVNSQWAGSKRIYYLGLGLNDKNTGEFKLRFLSEHSRYGFNPGDIDFKTITVSDYSISNGIAVGIIISEGTGNGESGTVGNPYIANVYFSQEGSCGNSATFSLDGDKMTISGTGSIDSSAFKNYPIKSVVINEGITSIGDNAFDGTDISSVSLPSTLETIGANAFDNCTSLTEVDLSACGNLTQISDSAFRNCTNLETVNIAACNKLEIIGKAAFAHSGLQSITIADSVMTVDEYALSDTPLKTVILLGDKKVYRDTTGGGGNYNVTPESIRGELRDPTITVTNNFSGVFEKYEYSTNHPWGVGQTGTAITYIVPAGSYYNTQSGNSYSSGTSIEIKQSNLTTTHFGMRSDSTIKLFASSFDEKRPTMQVVINDASRVRVNYFIPMTEGHFSADSYVVSYGGKAKDLSEASDSSDGYSGFSFTIECAAKEIADENDIIISDESEELFNIKEISVATYLKTILNSYEYSQSKYDNLKYFIRRMLQYGAAAQQFFDHHTENMANANLEGWSLDHLDAVEGSTFTAAQFNAVLPTDVAKDLTYYGLNMSFVSDTTFLLAFKFSEECVTEDDKNAAKTALETFLESKETGDFVGKVEYSLDTSKNYVIARIEGISLRDLGANIYSFDDFDVKATDYLIKTGAESSSASANMKTLAKALWTFYKAALILAGQS